MFWDASVVLPADGRPTGTTLLTFDERLRNVALREGFDVPEIN